MADVQNVVVPDLGGADDVDVIEVLVKPGDTVNEEDSLVTLESDKATMDVPAPFSGTVKDIKIKVGDKVSEGSVILTVATAGGASKPEKTNEKATPANTPAKASAAKTSAVAAASTTHVAVDVATIEETAVDSSLHATPTVRRIASEFGVDLRRVNPTGPKGRITKEDMQLFVKQQLASGGSQGGAGLPAAPVVDFTQFGDVEVKALNKIKKLTGANLSRNWLLAPHVTQFDEVDITDMEAFRQANKAQAEKQGFKLTPLVFIMKAAVQALKQFPNFNASLSADGSELVLKKYFHIGIAVDTPNGLVVPVVRDVDQKGFFDLAKELGEISQKARDGKLMPKDMQGGCFTISSLGGIGGTAFTPIINLPEVAILGVSKSQMKPVYDNGQCVGRLMLPLSLSYDHRVIDGAEGARFVTYLGNLLTDLRKILL